MSPSAYHRRQSFDHEAPGKHFFIFFLEILKQTLQNLEEIFLQYCMCADLYNIFNSSTVKFLVARVLLNFVVLILKSRLFEKVYYLVLNREIFTLSFFVGLSLLLL